MESEVELCVEVGSNIGDTWVENADINQLCRSCANTHDNMIPIFEGDGLEHDLQNKIDKHFPVNISRDDGLPHQMCYQCASTLVAWHDMYMGCIDAENKLKNLLKKSTAKGQVEKTVAGSSIASAVSASVEPDSQQKMASEMEVDNDDNDDDDDDDVPEHGGDDNDDEEDDDDDNDDEDEEVEEIVLHKLEAKAKEKNVEVNEKGTTIRDQIMVVRNDINRKQLISLVFHMNGNEKTLELSTDFLEKSDVGGNGTIIKGLVEYVRQKYRVSNNETIDVIVKPTCIKIGNESLKKPAIMKKNHFRASQLNSGSDEQGYYSKECNLRYENKHNFEAHLETHESVNQLSVEEFDKRITDQSALGKDFETPNNETIDGEKYKNITDGEAHDKSLKKRNIKKTVYCETCNKSISKNFYRYHMKNFHLGLKEHACDICGRSFAQKGAMMEHKRIHTEERPFICDICGHGFALKKSMVDHRRVHTGEMPFICDICGRCFAQRGSMREHRRIHTGERPFICQVCGKAVRTFSILFKHLKLHSDERPYSCQTCHKTFKYSNSLVRHNVTHTGEKNYVCELCGKRFGSSSELRVHKSAHSGLNLFPCPKCNLTFKFRDSLRKHIRRKHFLESKTALTLVQNIASNETKHILIDNFINQQHNPVDETVEAPNVLQNIEATMNETDEPLEFDKIHQT